MHWEKETLLTDTSIILLRPKEAVHYYYGSIVLWTGRASGLVEMVDERNDFLDCRIAPDPVYRKKLAKGSPSGKPSKCCHLGTVVLFFYFFCCFAITGF